MISNMVTGALVFLLDPYIAGLQVWYVSCYVRLLCSLLSILDQLIEFRSPIHQLGNE